MPNNKPIYMDDGLATHDWFPNYYREIPYSNKLNLDFGKNSNKLSTKKNQIQKYKNKFDNLPLIEKKIYYKIVPKSKSNGMTRSNLDASKQLNQTQTESMNNFSIAISHTKNLI